MQKRMFNNKYSLTKATLNGSKTITRDAIDFKECKFHRKYIDKTGNPAVVVFDKENFKYREIKPRYKVGEIVAVAQSYKDVSKSAKIEDCFNDMLFEAYCLSDDNFSSLAGWNNKMFVKADLMPHQIKITDVRAERMQDISDEDCLKEGVVDNWEHVHTEDCNRYFIFGMLDNHVFETPQEAFSYLIDKIGGKGIWESNPFVWVYEFELIK